MPTDPAARPALRLVDDAPPPAGRPRRAAVAIDEAVVAGALRHLRSPRQLTGHPLAALVALRPLVAADRVDDARARALALAELLRAVVGDGLRQRRGAAEVAEDAPRAEFEAALFDDFAAGDVEREAWSVLYHRFAAPARWPAKRIERVGACSRRTVLRRLNLGVALVSQRLRALERAAGGGPAAPADALGAAWQRALAASGSSDGDADPVDAPGRFGLRAIAASMLLDHLERALGDAWRPDGLQ